MASGVPQHGSCTIVEPGEYTVQHYSCEICNSYIDYHRSLNDLLDAVKAENAGTEHNLIPYLTNSIRVGLKYHDDMQLKIPRDEVEALRDIVIQSAKATLGKSYVNGMSTGSYRRGKTTSGDCDVLITVKNSSIRNGDELLKMMQHVVMPLHDRGFIKVEQRQTHSRSRCGFHPICFTEGGAD